MRHVDPKNRAAEERVGAAQVFANCAPTTLAAMLPQSARGGLERAYGGRPLSISLFSAHFGLDAPPAQFGLDRYGQIVLPEWMKSLRDFGACARMFAADPGDRLPAYGIANYGAIDSGLADGGPILVSVVGLDRFDNWSALTPGEEKDRRERWLDAFQGALDRDYPGLGAAVSERMFLNARSMRGFLNTPDGADLRLRAAAARTRHLGGDCRARPGRRSPASTSPRPSPARAGSPARCSSGAQAARAAMSEKRG